MSAEIPQALDGQVIEAQIREVLSRHGTIQCLKVQPSGENLTVSAQLRLPNPNSEGEMNAYRAAQPKAEPEQSDESKNGHSPALIRRARSALGRLSGLVSRIRP